MIRRLGAAMAVALLLAQGAWAQARDVYIQVEARSSLAGAEASARTYGLSFDNVAGFALGGGWYGIALGPYTEAQAGARLAELRRFGRIPPDAYLEARDDYGNQFWPVGAAAQPEAGQAQAGQSQAGQTPQVETRPLPDEPDLGEGGDTGTATAQADRTPAVPRETPAEARAAERRLTRDDREELQVALQWAGHYNGRIDAAFGRGTRGAMSDWQSANGFEPTGVLTTGQRAELLRQYNAVFDGLGMRRVADRRAGIAMEMPADALSFDRYDPPFAVFDPAGDLAVRLLLISQPGDSRTLAGLYEILQTLEIVPLEGPRARDNDSFSLTGRNDRIVSHTEARLSGGEIKGFTLVWPAGDEERRTRVLERMQDSFERLDGVLDPAQVTDVSASVDLVSGLEVRQPRASGSGFFVSPDGAVLTSAAMVEGCSRVTLDGSYEARVVARDAALGAALLRPEGRLAPRQSASFRGDAPRRQYEVAVAGYPYGGVLSAPTLTFGTLEELNGLGGEEDRARLTLAAEAGDAGGPVLDDSGAVFGMLLPGDDDSGQRLPQNVRFAASGTALRAMLQEAGVSVTQAGIGGRLAPEDLTDRAAAMTVLVSCWD